MHIMNIDYLPLILRHNAFVHEHIPSNVQSATRWRLPSFVGELAMLRLMSPTTSVDVEGLLF